MSFTMQFTKPDDTVGNFWSIYTVEINPLTQEKLVKVGLWKDANAFNASPRKMPMLVKSYRLPLSGKLVEANAFLSASEEELLAHSDFEQAVEN